MKFGQLKEHAPEPTVIMVVVGRWMDSLIDSSIQQTESETDCKTGILDVGVSSTTRCPFTYNRSYFPLTATYAPINVHLMENKSHTYKVFQSLFSTLTTNLCSN